MLSLIGAGGMGEVYRARDTKLGRDVAIKVVAREFVSDPEQFARVEREARVLATLNHPHIGAIYGLEDAGGVRGLVLELVEGATLAERLVSGPLPIPEALAVARQIAEALEAAHEKRHRAPRSQTRQHHDHAGRRREGARLRPRQGVCAGRSGPPRRRCPSPKTPARR